MSRLSTDSCSQSTSAAKEGEAETTVSHALGTLQCHATGAFRSTRLARVVNATFQYPSTGTYQSPFMADLRQRIMIKVDRLVFQIHMF